jgi:hypothetical protein
MLKDVVGGGNEIGGGVDERSVEVKDKCQVVHKGLKADGGAAQRYRLRVPVSSRLGATP